MLLLTRRLKTVSPPEKLGCFSTKLITKSRLAKILISSYQLRESASVGVGAFSEYFEEVPLTALRDTHHWPPD